MSKCKSRFHGFQKLIHIGRVDLCTYDTYAIAQTKLVEAAACRERKNAGHEPVVKADLRVVSSPMHETVRRRERVIFCKASSQQQSHVIRRWRLECYGDETAKPSMLGVGDEFYGRLSEDNRSYDADYTYYEDE